MRLFLTLILVMFIAAPSSAEESKTEIFVANTNPEFVIDHPENPANSYTVEVLLQGGQPGEVIVEFLDYVSGPQGRVTLPGGSTPGSLQNAIFLEGGRKKYVPNGKSQIFELRFLPLDSIESRLYSGGLRIGFQALGDDSGISTSTLGVTKNLVVTPYGGASILGSDQLLPARFVSNKLTPLQRSSFIDSLIPDIPGVINFGPVEVNTTIENPGEFPVFSQIRWEFSQGEELLASQEVPAKLMAGGVTFERKVQTVFVDPTTKRSINVLPNFGLIQMETTVTSELTGVTLDNQVSTDTFLLLMWKEPLVMGIIFVGLYRGLRRSRPGRLRNIAKESDTKDNQ